MGFICMIATMTLQSATYAASSEEELMGEGGTMAGVRYSVGRTLVRIQEAVVLEAPFVFCAAKEISVGRQIVKQ